MNDSTIVLNAGGGGTRLASDLNLDGVETLGVAILGPIERSARGDSGVAIYIQDQTTGVLDIPFLLPLNTTLLAADTVVNDNEITLTAGHNTIIGNRVEMADTTNGSWFYVGIALNVVGDVITMDSPAPRVFTTANTLVLIGSNLMNVAGSIATPVVFEVAPTPQQIGDIVRVILTITGNSAMDFESFGDIPALTNGCVLRVNNGDGTYRNIYNFKDNNDIAAYAFDTGYFENNGGNLRGYQARLTWGGQSKHGVVVRLDGSLGETIELVIQDDLTALNSMDWLAQGSEVQE
jgi:hypothetical protein